MTSYEIKIFIADKNRNWVDFSDRLQKQGTNRLGGAPTVTYKTSDKVIGGVFLASVGGIILDNSDGFFDNPDAWDSLKTIDNDNAEWNKSINNREVSLLKAFCKLSVNVFGVNGKNTRKNLGVFRVLNLSTNSTSGNATLKLASLSYGLTKVSADKIKNGRAWYNSRSVIFLIKELLKLEFSNVNIEGIVTSTDTNLICANKSFPDWVVGASVKNVTDNTFGIVTEKISSTELVVDADNVITWTSGDTFSISGVGTLPSTFSFPNALIMSTWDGNRAVSNYGRPPDRFLE